MSTDPSSTKSLFVVYAPDYPDPECLSRRLSVRATHLSDAAKLFEQGILKIGGAMITPETYKTDQKKMVGSTLIYSGDSIEQIREIVENDIYYKSNVWDKEKLTIFPFVSAKPLFISAFPVSMKSWASLDISSKSILPAVQTATTSDTISTPSCASLCITMPFKRPALPHASSSGQPSPSDSKEEIEGPSKRSKVSKSTKALPDIKLYIIQAKLSSPRIAELFTLAERHCQELCRDVDEADVVVTAISMRRRLERHMSWEIATAKAIVTPEWLTESVHAGHCLPCKDYIAVQDLRNSTLNNCPDCQTLPCECEETDYGSTHSPVVYPSPPLSAASTSVKRRKASHESIPALDLRKEIQTACQLEVPSHLLPPQKPLSTNLERLTYTSRYACQRASPLVCPNQELALELDIIRRSRALEGEETSALSYARAISVIKAYPHRITSISQTQRLPHIGTKITGLVEEFLDTGRITEARNIASSERFETLTDFSTVYGIGPHSARRLFNLGLRTFEDLEVYYGADPASAETELMELEKEDTRQGWHGQGQNQAPQRDDLGESWIKVALGLRADLSKTIPRDEVEEISKVIMHELTVVEPGCVSTVVGGYRRGKAGSNDVDIVFTHPDGSKIKGLCKRLVCRLHEQRMVSHVMHLSNFHGHNPLRTTHWDSLEKALTVLTLPKSSSLYTGTRRRVDLIFANPDVYWCAVVGWSGSIMFQRDLRQWANDKCGMRFDSSGITRRYDSKAFYPKTEQEVFDLFGLEWVDPTWRNADV